MRCLAQRLCLILVLILTPQLTYAKTCPKALTRISAASNGGFTITELLVTIGVIAVLVSLTLPALSKSRQAARDVKCLSNLKQAITSTHAYVNDYKVLPVHTINNVPGNPTAFVDLGIALEINQGIRKAWQCPSDAGFDVGSGETVYHSYVYMGMAAMMTEREPYQFIPEQAVRRFEKDLTRDLFNRLPVYLDARTFHHTRVGAPHYTGGRQNAAWWDGRVQKIPLGPGQP